MFIVIDDVMDEPHREAVVSYFSRGIQARNIKWQAGKINQHHQDNSPLSILLSIASKYFDLSDMMGCEYWSNYGTRPDWHIDKDEKLFTETGNINCPICSIVYYADIDTIGGNFITENITIKPITNRMIVFSPNINHKVEPYTGTRLSVAVNPWTTKPMTHR